MSPGALPFSSSLRPRRLAHCKCSSNTHGVNGCEQTAECSPKLSPSPGHTGLHFPASLAVRCDHVLVSATRERDLCYFQARAPSTSPRISLRPAPVCWKEAGTQQGAPRPRVTVELQEGGVWDPESSRAELLPEYLN